MPESVVGNPEVEKFLRMMKGKSFDAIFDPHEYLTKLSKTKIKTTVKSDKPGADQFKKESLKLRKGLFPGKP